MSETAEAQQIDIGPVHVDTGNDWLDFGFAIALFAVLIVGMIAYNRFKYPKRPDGTID